MASFDKINYLLRPSKQVERKLLIEAMQRLSKAGYFIHEYTYLGLGSVYYADFILFHKYLLIDNMVCAEIDPIEKRMKFNKPYDFIELYMEAVGNVFPKLDRTKRHLVWLDFDSSLDDESLSDIRSCIHVLAPGSVFLVTVTAETRTLNDLLDPRDIKDLTDDQRKSKMVEALDALMGKHIGRQIVRADISKNKLPLVYIDALRGFINTCVDSRQGLKFYQLFNFKYADNLQMVTFGGIIDDDSAVQRLTSSGIYDLDFVSSDSSLIHISVPPMTIQEKIWLEKHIINNPKPPDMQFEIHKEMVQNFIKYYRHYPVYYEGLL